METMEPESADLVGIGDSHSPRSNKIPRSSFRLLSRGQGCRLFPTMLVKKIRLNYWLPDKLAEPKVSGGSKKD